VVHLLEKQREGRRGAAARTSAAACHLRGDKGARLRARSKAAALRRYCGRKKDAREDGESTGKAAARCEPGMCACAGGG
jgi:hypothetical protein